MKLLIALAALGIIASPAAAQDRSRNWHGNQACNTRDQRDRPECRDRNRSSMDRRDWRDRSNDRNRSYSSHRRYHQRTVYRHRWQHRDRRHDNSYDQPHG